MALEKPQILAATVDVMEEDQSSSDTTPSKEDKCRTCGHLWPVIFCTFMVMGGRRSARKGALADEDTEMKDVTNTK